MNCAKTLVFSLVALLALNSCSDSNESSVRPGLRAGPTPSVPGNGGPYAFYFANLNRSIIDSRLSSGDLHMVAAANTGYDVLQSLAPQIQRESIAMSYKGFISLATLRVTSLTPSEMFYIDPGFFFRTDVDIAGKLQQQQISSIDTLQTVCDRINNAFIDSFVASTFILELPGIDNDCNNRLDNVVLRLTEDFSIYRAPDDITASLTINSSLTPLKNISTLRNLSGDASIVGYLVQNGLSLIRFDANFANSQNITHNAQTSLEVGSGGTGLLGSYVTVDGSVYRYNDQIRSLESTPIYSPVPAGNVIDAYVCKKEECVFVENTGAGVLNLWVAAADSNTPAVQLMPNMQDIGGVNSFDSVLSIIRNSQKITFTATNTDTTNGAIGLYQIDISKLSSPLELHKVNPAMIAEPLVTVSVDNATSIDLFATNGLVHYNKDYDRINDLGASSIAVVMTPDLTLPIDPSNDRTQYPTSAWVGVINTEVSRENVIEKIILAKTIEKPPATASDPPTGIPQTSLASYFVSAHTLSASLGTLEEGLDVVHMSFDLVGNQGLGDAYIAKSGAALPINPADPNALQTDVYFVNGLAASSLTRITATDTADESAFSTCVNVTNLVCR